jgi:hypothetical protein
MTIMFFNRKRNYALTGAEWEAQRELYLANAQWLSQEFEIYKKQLKAVRRTPTVKQIAINTQSKDQQVFRLPKGYRQMRVLAGGAWVTCEGKDYVLYSGDELVLGRNSHNVVVSRIECDSLRFEITP